MEVRLEQPEDIEAIHRVNALAFGREDEADLVDRLRDVVPIISLVAVDSNQEQILGHILFSPVAIAGQCPDDLHIAGLAPIAVLPDYQRQGIGAQLMQDGLKECDRQGFKAVVVLGHPAYYPKFGFIPAKEKGLKCEYEVPDEAFMVLELQSDALAGCVGTIKYCAEFAILE